MDVVVVVVALALAASLYCVGHSLIHEHLCVQMNADANWCTGADGGAGGGPS